MKSQTLIGLALVVLGVLALVYQGISYTKREKVVDIGPIEATHEERKTIPLPPILGAIAMIGGIVLIARDRKWDSQRTTDHNFELEESNETYKIFCSGAALDCARDVCITTQ